MEEKMKRNQRKQFRNRILAWCLAAALLAALLPDNFYDRDRSDGRQSAQAADASFASANGEVMISLREVEVNDYWYEYYLTIENNAARSICDWSLTLQVSDISLFSQGFECSGTVSDGKLVVKGTGNNQVIAAGSTLSSSSGFKLGFGGQVSFRSGEIAYSYGSQSQENTGDGVGYGNTYLSGYRCEYTLTGQTKELAFSETPAGRHGALHVDGTRLKDASGQDMILRGVSTHGMHWGEMSPFVNKAAFQNLRDEWGVNLIRLVSYVTQGGYTQGSASTLDALIQNGVSYASELGMYALIDWHIHAENPNDTKAEAIAFFDKYSKMYGDKENILYEICNEPTDTPWPQIKSYAQDVVKTIRANDPDAVIIVGTNTWSQDVDEVAVNGGKLDGDNIMYTVHFYSGSHGQSLRDKVSTALTAGTPVFCTEFGVCDASGNGGFNLEEADAWIDFFEKQGISYCCWSLCNKDESASMISPQSDKKSGWTNEDLGATGAWLINTYRTRGGEQPDAEPTTDVPDSAGPSGGVEASTEPSAAAAVSAEPSASEPASSTPKATVPAAGQSPMSTVLTAVTDMPGSTSAPPGKTALPAGSTASSAPAQQGGSVADTDTGDDSASRWKEQQQYVLYATAKHDLSGDLEATEKAVSFRSSKPKVAAVNGKGVVTGKKAGRAMITIRLADGSVRQYYVTVKMPKVTLKKKKITLRKKKVSRALRIRKKLTTDRVKKYRLSRKGIIEINKKGVIKGLRKGRVTVTVLMKSGAKANCKVRVR